MRKIHPIWWLVGFSVAIGVANGVMKGPQQSSVASSAPPDYQAAVEQMIADITDIDAYGDMTWKPQYRAVVLELDVYCTERLSQVVDLSVEAIEHRRDDSQFALLNEMENTLYLAKQAPQAPTTCESLIGQSR